MRKQAGLTLIEIMVVIFILGIMAAVVAPNIFGSQEKAMLKKAAIDIQNLEQTLEQYRLDNAVYPTTEQGLEALVNEPSLDPLPRNYQNGGYIRRLPEDPWGQPYQLLSPGEMGRVDVYSMGPDRQPGTEDDIGNWNLNDYL